MSVVRWPGRWTGRCSWQPSPGAGPKPRTGPSASGNLVQGKEEVLLPVPNFKRQLKKCLISFLSLLNS